MRLIPDDVGDPLSGNRAMCPVAARTSATNVWLKAGLSLR